MAKPIIKIQNPLAYYLLLDRARLFGRRANCERPPQEMTALSARICCDAFVHAFCRALRTRATNWCWWTEPRGKIPSGCGGEADTDGRKRRRGRRRRRDSGADGRVWIGAERHSLIPGLSRMGVIRSRRNSRKADNQKDGEQQEVERAGHKYIQTFSKIYNSIGILVNF